MWGPSVNVDVRERQRERERERRSYNVFICVHMSTWTGPNCSCSSTGVCVLCVCVHVMCCVCVGVSVCLCVCVCVGVCMRERESSVLWVFFEDESSTDCRRPLKSTQKKTSKNFGSLRTILKSMKCRSFGSNGSILIEMSSTRTLAPTHEYTIVL